MENATKALLIAAAVLIVIVLISLGVNLLSTASDTSGKANSVSSALNSQIYNKANTLSNTINNLK